MNGLEQLENVEEICSMYLDAADEEIGRAEEHLLSLTSDIYNEQAELALDALTSTINDAWSKAVDSAYLAGLVAHGRSPLGMGSE